MDTWKFYDITHREHVVCNPTSEEKLARLVELVQLPRDARVVDIACGKGDPRPGILAHVKYTFDGLDLIASLVSVVAGYFVARALESSASCARSGR